jgi:excisionase family DNA binding protein
MQRETQTTKAQGIMPAATTHILTVDQVAARLQITKGAVYELTRFRQDANMPRLPARKVGRSLRFIAAEIDQWVLSLPQHTHSQKRQYIKKDAPTAQPAAPVKATQRRRVA